MQNFHAEGKTIEIVLDATYEAGDFIALTDRAGVVTKGGGSGDTRPVLVEGIVSYTKDAVAATQGQKLYYHSGSDKLTTSSSSAKAAGWACETTASTVLTTKVKLGAW